MNQKASILLVDDHPVFRQGLAAILRSEQDLKVVAEAGDGQIALEMIREYSPDIVVMDISMPNLDGIEATRQILVEFPDTKVVALSVHSGKRFVRDMLQAGAIGYMLKESVPQEMIDGIRTVLAGEVYLSKAISKTVISDYKQLLVETDQPGDTSLEPILGTKLQRPPISADIIPRGRLLKMLEAGRQRRLTLISAPAGYGKSTLTSQWVAVCQCRSAWLLLDEGDNDLRLFLRYLLNAIQQAFPSMSVPSASLLQSSSLPPIQVLVRSVLNDLEQLEEPVVLVLDDYHCIHHTAVHDLLTGLLHHSSALLHLVLLTRRDPPLPLSHLRVQGQLTEITRDHLRFNTEETRTFIERVLHVTIDEHTASVLETIIEGWVAGLRLVMLSLGQTWDPEHLVNGLTERASYVKEYLIDEVLSQVPPAVERYLLETSLLDRFCAPLCEVFRTVHKTPDNAAEEYLSGQAFIEWLEKTHLFVILLDETHHWFRYQRLFQQILRNQVKQQQSVAEIARLHGLASAWFAENGLIDEALRHSLAAGDIPTAMQLVVQHGHNLMSDQQWSDLEDWLSQLPRDQLEQNPELLLLEAWQYHTRQNFSGMGNCVEKIEALMSTSSQSASHIQSHVDALRGIQHYLAGDGESALTCLRRTCQNIPLHHKRKRVFAHIFQIGAYQMVGDLAAGLSVYQEEMNACILRDKTYHATYLANLCFIYWIDADLTALRQTAEGGTEALQEAPTARHGPLRAIFFGNRSLSP